jgi:transposase
MAIIKAILAGERDPGTRAQLRARRCTPGEEQIAKALQGTWRAEHLFALRQPGEVYAFDHHQLATCDVQIAAQLATFPDQSGGQALPPNPRKSKRKAHAPRCDGRTPRSRMAGVDLTALAGLEAETALVILSAMGTDMSPWPSGKHFCRGLGRSPCHKVSGGKGLSRRVRPGAHRVAVALRLAAGSVHHSQSAFGAFCRRLRARLGAPQAITATAHKLAWRIYRLLKHGTASVQQGMEEYEAQYRDRKGKGMARQAKALG